MSVSILKFDLQVTESSAIFWLGY